ncbi:hypothetical protein PQZ64_gp50 [Klebsiella phage vB_KpnM_IME346]|uniref:Uncharacterized protein n=1 Tax=Klebsiella phage vB_KpnM_IME346 TaxID=2562174 RepID=A0A4D6DT86_9CAUD|nr:hypothetical protein PQZ64_gp50 [Klebsiella phage vB_KpnM_IME346]QBZ68949.1 hypothetical protein [Klebsiella phage vB_KpnM_IME346]
MTLLEILRQELPKRGGWPEGVREISTHASGRVFFDGRFAPQGFTLPMASDAWNKHKHPRSYTNAVTRGQYEATGWDGTGLPPVGVECEVSVDGGRSWCTYRTISEKNGARLIEIGNFTEEFQSNNWIFRPLRTEAERAIDEMVRLSGVSIGAAKILYDAGYRKG